jgi:hypothetical protein
MKSDTLQTLRAAARERTDENIANPTEQDYLLVENAMIAGADLALREELKQPEPIMFTATLYSPD